jgi:hypothetical protein
MVRDMYGACFIKPGLQLGHHPLDNYQCTLLVLQMMCKGANARRRDLRHATTIKLMMIRTAGAITEQRRSNRCVAHTSERARSMISSGSNSRAAAEHIVICHGVEEFTSWLAFCSTLSGAGHEVNCCLPQKLIRPCASPFLKQSRTKKPDVTNEMLLTGCRSIWNIKLPHPCNRNLLDHILGPKS